ncbi:hypothetical protein NPX13_g1227 [Xylaria arbuscula]|uniref:Uncharacterized protein n=1 Tax=Xylaria arbuscula TaxID=114810 RepID=A0A9W8NLF2_9PEZI|nr:hypothetical protein NPX13_g1227 [Xylaria arbuscula]
MTPKTSGNTPQYKITVIPVNDEGSRFYLEKYKPFRLASLQQDPQAFGSTYERELAFDEETWLSRIKNPLATTFVAVRADNSSNQIVASTALIGPLPSTTAITTTTTSNNPASNPYQVILREQ